MRNLLVVLLFAAFACGQQAQTTDLNPQALQGYNAKWAQGVGPGYWPTLSSGLVVHLTKGTAWCNGTIATYASGTLTMTNNTTNYIYLDTSSSCVPAVKTTVFALADIPIAVVVAASGVLTSITDDRTWFVPANGCPTLTGDVTSIGCATTLANTAVTPGSYSNATITVDSKGRITAASNGTGGGGSSIPAYGGTYCSVAIASGAVNALNCPSVYNVVANKIIIAFCGSNQTAGTTFSDSGPGGGAALTWTTIASINNAGNTVNESAFWANPGSATGADTFTCHFTTSVAFDGMTVSEIVGATVGAPIDTSTTKAAAGTQQIALSPSSTDDLVMFGMDNSGTATLPVGFFTILNNTGVANAVLWGPIGPYNFSIGMGTNGAALAVAIH